jgi:hypothetical protein
MMKRWRPEDVYRQPYFLFPLMGVACAIPILFGLSDRAAAFAGGLSAGIAAVVAVVLSAIFARENEATKDRRHRNTELKALVTEVSIILSLSSAEIRRTRESLDALNRARTYPVPSLSRFSTYPPKPPPDKTGPPNSVWRIVIERSLYRLPDRVSTRVAEMDRATAQAVVEYEILSSTIRENLGLDRTFPPEQPLSDQNLTGLVSLLKNLEGLASKACELVDHYAGTLVD